MVNLEVNKKIHNEFFSQEKAIGRRIKELREKLGLKQAEFADYVGISQGSLSRIEKGTQKADKTLILAICNVFRVNIDWLLTGEGDMFVKKEEEPMIISGGIGNIQTKGEGNVIGGIQISIGEKGEKNELEITTDMEINDKVKKVIKLLLEGHYTPLIIDEILDKLEKIKEINKGVG